MNFEEQFPSLKGKGTLFERFIGTSPDKDRTTYRFANTWKAFTEANIKNNCLDKQKVKEEFDLIQRFIGKKGVNLVIYDLIEEKKKELGLE